MNDVHSFGEWVRRRRLALDFTRARLADHVGCSPETIKKIERGERRPSRQLSELLAKHLRIAPESAALFVSMGRGQKVQLSVKQLATDHALAPSTASQNDDHQPWNNLPAQANRFIGREHELREIRGLLGPNSDCRMLTLVAPGGMGKTRLAIEAASSVRALYADGVLFAALAPHSTADQLVNAIAGVVGIRFRTGSDTLAQIVAILRTKHALLVLDNFEQLLGADGVISVLDAILEAAPEVRLLVTSRERLSVQQEWIMEVPGLQSSGGGDEKAPDAHSGPDLFMDRARQVRPEFTLSAEEHTHVVAICDLVGGMPLALELAAVWARLLQPSQIRREIELSPDFLSTNLRNMPTRHQNIRTIFDHSWDRLSPEEQAIFCKLSLFRGGFTHRAAGEVANASLHILAALVDKSMLRASQTGRYDIHELLRQYAEASLVANEDEYRATRDAHAAYFCHFVAEQEVRLKGSAVLEAMTDIALELDNIRLAWDWAIESRRLSDLLISHEGLGWFYYWPGRHSEGFDAFERAVAMTNRSAASAESSEKQLRLLTRLLPWQARFGIELGRFAEGLTMCQQAQSLLRSRPNVNETFAEETANVLAMMSKATSECLSDSDAAIRYCQQALKLYRKLDDRWNTAYSLAILGEYATSAEEYALAESTLRESVDLAKELGHSLQLVWPMSRLGRVLAYLGRLEEARYWVEQAVKLSRELNYIPGIYSLAMTGGRCAIYSGQYEAANELLQAGMDLDNDMEAVIVQGKSGMLRAWAAVHQADYALATILLRESARTAYVTFLSAIIYLLNEEYDQALDDARESVALAMETSQMLHFGLAKSVESLALTLAGRREGAWPLQEGLETSLDIRAYLPVLLLVSAAAVLKSVVGEHARAVELYALATEHPHVGNSKWYADVVEPRIEVSASQLSLEEARASRERGRNADLWREAELILAELRGSVRR